MFSSMLVNYFVCFYVSSLTRLRKNYSTDCHKIRGIVSTWAKEEIIRFL